MYKAFLQYILMVLTCLWTLTQGLSEGEKGWMCDEVWCYKHNATLSTFTHAAHACGDDHLLPFPVPDTLRHLARNDVIWVRHQAEVEVVTSRAYVMTSCLTYNMTSRLKENVPCDNKHTFICRATADKYSVLRILGLKLFDFAFLVSVAWILFALFISFLASSAHNACREKRAEEMRRFWAQKIKHEQRRRVRSSTSMVLGSPEDV